MATQTVEQTTIIDMLKQDHEVMKELFDAFKDAEYDEKKKLMAEALEVIEEHDQIESALLYPEAADESSVSRELLLRCEEAHHVVRLLMAELALRPVNERSFAKFQKLISGVREHIEEEENELFPELERSDMDLEKMGREMRKMRSSGAGAFVRGAGGKLAIIGLLAGIGWAVYDTFFAGE
jgi:hemerythrin-like domain-containing protein